MTGTVTEQGTGVPLSGVRVVALHAATYQFAASTTTGTNGGYTLDLNPGDYKVAFVEPTGRHNMEWHNNLPYNGLASAASVTAPGVVNAALAPNTAAMAGTIVDDSTSAPVAGAWVLAIGPTGVTGGAVTGSDVVLTLGAEDCVFYGDGLPSVCHCIDRSMEPNGLGRLYPVARVNAEQDLELNRVNSLIKDRAIDCFTSPLVAHPLSGCRFFPHRGADGESYDSVLQDADWHCVCQEHRYVLAPDETTVVPVYETCEVQSR